MVERLDHQHRDKHTKPRHARVLKMPGGSRVPGERGNPITLLVAVAALS
jgi:hypothetical protein